MFEKGEQCCSQKMSPAAMLEELTARHADRFDLPTENDIRREVSYLNKRKRNETQDAPKAKKKRGRSGMKEDFVSALASYVEENPKIPPRRAVEMLKSSFNDGADCEDFPGDSAIKARAGLPKRRKKAKEEDMSAR